MRSQLALIVGLLLGCQSAGPVDDGAKAEVAHASRPEIRFYMLKDT